MDAGSVVRPAEAMRTPNRRPYQPSWVDRLHAWVSRLPVAPWAFYFGLWLLFVLLESITKWLDGFDFGLRWIYFLYCFYGFYFLAAVHYLDAWARTAFDTFRPTLEVGEAESALLFYQLTTMPARTVWLLSGAALAGTIVLIRPLIVPLWEGIGFVHHSRAAMLVDLGIFALNALIVILFIYHTLRQMRWTRRIHQMAAGVDPFQPGPLYALSGLTARTAAILLLVAGIFLLVGFIIVQQGGLDGIAPSDPNALRMTWLFTLVSTVVWSLLGAAAFFLPLQGLHQRLGREKERLQAEANSRLQAQIQELHRRLDAHVLEDADAINKQLASLALERDILAKLPTWPWQPGLFNLILSAVLLPTLLWFLLGWLGRWMGF